MKEGTKWVDPKPVFELFLNPENSPLGTQKVKNDPKIKPKLNVKIEGNIENGSCSTTWVEPKTVFEPFSNAKKYKMTPKLSQSQMSELKETKK